MNHARVATAFALVWVLALIASPTALAQSQDLSVPTTETELARYLDPAIGTVCETDRPSATVEGLGLAAYLDLQFDSALGTAVLSGGVCVELEGDGAILRTDLLELDGIDTGDAGPSTPVLAAQVALLDIAGWRVWTTELEGSIDDITLGPGVVLGPGVIGLTEGGYAADEGWVLEGVAIVTDRYLLEATQGQIVGGSLQLVDVRATSCACRDAPFTLLGELASFELKPGATSGTVGSPRLQIAGASIPLGGDLRIGPSGVDFDFPFTLRFDRELGSLVGLRAPGFEAGELAFGVTAEANPSPWLAASVEEGPASASIRFDPRGVRVAVGTTVGTFLGATVQTYGTFDFQDDPSRVVIGADARWRNSIGVTDAATLAWQARLGAQGIVEPDAGRYGVYLPVEGTASLTQAWEGLQVGVESSVTTGAAFWADEAQPQNRATPLAVAVTPSARLEGEGWRVSAAATRRVVVSTTDFGASSIDPRSRLTGQLVLYPAWARLELDGTWRFRPEAEGAEQLRATLSSRITPAEGWSLEPALLASLAGWYGGKADDAYLLARLKVQQTAWGAVSGDVRLNLPNRVWNATSVSLSLAPSEGPSWSGSLAWSFPEGEITSVSGTLEGRFAARQWFSIKAALDTTAEELTQLEPRIMWPLVIDVQRTRYTVTPFLAVNALPLLQGEDVTWLGHGARLEVDDPSGGFFLAYQRLEDETRFDFGVSLPPFRIEGSPANALPNASALYGVDP